VGTDATNSIQRINLASDTVDETIPLGSSSYSSTLTAGNMQVMPGSPGTIAVVRVIANTSPSEAADVAIFDGTSMRPNTAGLDQGTGLIIDVVAFSDSGSTLYGLDNEDGISTFTRMNVNASGVSVQDTTPLLLGFGYHATMAYSSGLVYSTFGTILSTSTLSLQGRFPPNPSSLQGQSPYAESVLVNDGVPYLLTHNQTYGAMITAYDPQTYLETAASVISIASSDDENSLVPCGNGCFAFIEITGLPNLTTSVAISTGPLVPVAATPPTLGNLTPNHILWNAAAQVLYASIPGKAGSWGNSVAVINPATQAIENTIFVGSDPDVLALSADGAYLYVGLDGSTSIARLNLASNMVDLTFFLGPEPNVGGPTLPASISVSPGDSTTVAVARLNPDFQPEEETVTIYQQGLALPNATSDGTTVAFCNSGSVLYGLDGQSSDAFFTMSVDGTGALQTGAAEGLIGGKEANIICDANIVYASTGYAVDPLSNTQLGIFPGLQTPAALAVDDTNEKVFFLDNNSGNSVSIVGFDQSSYSQTGTLSVTAATSSARDLARWGANGFAVATQSQVLLLSGTLP
jgi:hypothetical protein